jgi:hypothetical protein
MADKQAVQATTPPEKCPYCGHGKVTHWLSPFYLTARWPDEIPPKVDRACDGGCGRMWLSSEGVRNG